MWFKVCSREHNTVQMLWIGRGPEALPVSFQRTPEEASASENHPTNRHWCIKFETCIIHLCSILIHRYMGQILIHSVVTRQYKCDKINKCSIKFCWKQYLLPDMKEYKINKVSITTFSCLHQSCVFLSLCLVKGEPKFKRQNLTTFWQYFFQQL